mgnify:FL=1|tara:strand:+ start:167 stop:613 length:447 start_codon:yes stop_codon:yes gene_type:complete
MRLLAKERNFISNEIKKLMEQHHLKKLERIKQTKEYQVFDSERKSLFELDLEITKLKDESRVRHMKLQNKIRNYNRRKGFQYNSGIEIPYQAYHVPLRIEWDSYGCYQEAVERDIMMNSFKELDVPKFIKDLFNKYKNLTYKQIQELD